MIHIFAEELFAALVFGLANDGLAISCSKQSHSVTTKRKIVVRIVSFVCNLTHVTFYMVLVEGKIMPCSMLYAFDEHLLLRFRQYWRPTSMVKSGIEQLVQQSFCRYSKHFV